MHVFVVYGHTMFIHLITMFAKTSGTSSSEGCEA